MWRFLYGLYRLVAAIQRIIERRFTRAGMLTGGVLIVTAALGADTNVTVAYRVFAFAAALLLVGALGAWWQRGRYAVMRHLPRVVGAGEPFSYRVRVTNLAAAPRDAVALFDEAADPRPPLAAFRARLRFPTYRGWKRMLRERTPCVVDEAPLPAMAAGATVEATVHGMALRRGHQHFRGVTLARADPLGLVCHLTHLAAPANVLVLPRRYALPPVTLPGSRRYQPGGVAQAASVGDSEEFVGLRDYRPGDPLQRIHWKSYARAGEPVVREYHDEYFERHALILDTFGGTVQAAALDDAVSIAASLACTLDTQECLLDLLFVGSEPQVYTAGRGQMPAGGLLEVLAGVQLCGERPFQVLQEAVLARRAQMTGSVCVLLQWDEARREFVRLLRAQGVPLLVIVVSGEPVEERQPWLRVIAPGRVAEGLAAL